MVSVTGCPAEFQREKRSKVNPHFAGELSIQTVSLKDSLAEQGAELSP